MRSGESTTKFVTAIYNLISFAKRGHKQIPKIHSKLYTSKYSSCTYLNGHKVLAEENLLSRHLISAHGCIVQRCAAVEVLLVNVGAFGLEVKDN